MAEVKRPDSLEVLIAKAKTLQEDIKSSSEYSEALLRLNDELDEVQRQNGLFLLDKFVPILTAILGGVAYVLIEHKARAGWPLQCFRASGACLTLALLIVFARTWLDPFLAYGFKERMLAIKFRRTQPRTSWLVTHFDTLEAVRLFVVMGLVLAGLTLAAIATGLQSRTIAVASTAEPRISAPSNSPMAPTR